MDFSLSPAETRFRDELRDWLRADLYELMREPAGGAAEIEWRREWQRGVHDAGHRERVAQPVEL